MDKRIFKSFGFIIALCILLLNDFLLKGLFGNWFTGKLSDFAGLFVFALFWMAFFPKHRLKVLVLTGIGFAFWKSPWSQGMLDAWNGLGILPLDRVVDASDLLALLVLPFANWYAQSMEKMWQLKITPALPAVLSAFAFLATTYSTDFYPNKAYGFALPKDSIEARLSRIDSLNRVNCIKFSDSNPDTIEIDVPSQLCFLAFTATIELYEIDSAHTKMTFFHALHNCPKEKDDEQVICREFEEKVVAKLR